MMNAFDDLARAIAGGITRREALKRMGAGLAGIMLSSLGIKKAYAATVTCGTCQSCDLDTNTCGLPCNPASAGTTLCSMVTQDGTYLRLATYLTSNGFTQTGVSDAMLLYTKGALLQSGVTTNFTNPSVTGQTATIAYSVGPQGTITSFAVVLQSGSPVYGLSIDASGRVSQTVATLRQPAAPSNAAVPSGSQGGGSKQLQLPNNVAAAISPDLLYGLSPETCDQIVQWGCGVVGFGLGCFALGYFACAAEVLATFGLGAAAVVPCGIFVTLLCGAGGLEACNALQSNCDCAFNTQYCEGVCCGPCQDCSASGACVPAENVAACPSKVCCEGQCCPDGYTCVNGVCTSPDATCGGATCSTYMACDNNDSCFCGTLSDGGGLCQVSVYCDGLVLCPDGSCPDGSFCLVGSCCGDPVCVPDSAICTQASPDALAAVRPALDSTRKTTGPVRK